MADKDATQLADISEEVKEEIKENKTTVLEGPEGTVSKGADARWYVVHTQSGFEMKAKQALEQRIKTLGLEDKIFDIVIPMRDIVTIKAGKKRASKEKVFPGYILIRMILDDKSWIAVCTTQGITGFVGTGVKPTPITEKEVKAIIQFVDQEQPKFKAKFSTGEAVKITDGPFSDFIGTIEQIDENKGKVKVLVSIFGRETPVELDFLQVAKL
jgi:transcription termination/antitermination protein NusG